MKADLYSTGAPIGLLKGFSPLPHQLELDVVVPHNENGLPGFGEFLLVELGPTEAVVGRVSRYHAAGQLASERGDAYLTDLAKTESPVPPPIMQQMLRYNLKMHALGQIRALANGQFEFSVGERTFTTLGSKVRAPSHRALDFLCNVGLAGDPSAAELGHLAYGRSVIERVPIRFSVNRLKGKRSFVFARAGYGKSNLIKYLMAQLYSAPPDVGLLIFDPEGEYALPDAHGRPGLVNVPGLRDRISLYTNRHVEPPQARFKKGSLNLDFGDFHPSDILAAFVPAEKHDTVFANLLRGADEEDWRDLIDLLATHGFATNDQRMATLLHYKPRKDDVSLNAIRNNLVPAIKRLHESGATLGANIIAELRQNRIVIVDVSLLGGEDSLALTNMLLKRVFDHNVRRMTDVAGESVRCLAVLEEAQTFLGDRALDDRNIFVRWVKEGRKYNLGCVLVTQQPSSISNQIISQGDNFFVLHLLNDADLQTLRRHNAHYNEEILSFIRSEPIAGNCYFWSAPNQPFVVSARVRAFESICTRPQAVSTKTPRAEPSGLSKLVGLCVKDALNIDTKVWVHPVNSIFGKREAGLIACSQEYLRISVATRLAGDAAFAAMPDQVAWLQDRLPHEVETVLNRHRVRAGFANLAGSKRAVWVLPQSEVQLRKPKALRPAVEVFEEL
ncbi:MAG TPA: ATP-binding protein [Verrucomicrobiae bacterium]|nr:ATP-binding protein [Verrucomicrobiae bacterium]